jgi:hypothetical protein
MDTTPRSGDPEPDRPDNAPRWFLVLVVTIVAVGGVWVLMSLIGSRPL